MMFWSVEQFNNQDALYHSGKECNVSFNLIRARCSMPNIQLMWRTGERDRQSDPAKIKIVNGSNLSA